MSSAVWRRRVAEFLSPEWFERARSAAESLRERPGVDASLEWKVTAAPGGESTHQLEFESGRIRAWGLGPARGPAFALTSSYADARAVYCGELHLPSAFMRGQIKAAGDIGVFMAVLPVVNAPDFAGLVGVLRGFTDPS